MHLGKALIFSFESILCAYFYIEKYFNKIFESIMCVFVYKHAQVYTLTICCVRCTYLSVCEHVHVHFLCMIFHRSEKYVWRFYLYPRCLIALLPVSARLACQMATGNCLASSPVRVQAATATVNILRVL